MSDHVVFMVSKDPIICAQRPIHLSRRAGILSDLQVLRDDGSALLLAACADLDRVDATSATAGAVSPAASAPFTCYYAARPAADCAALLIRRSAVRSIYCPPIIAGSLARWHSQGLVHGLGLGVSRAHAFMQAGVTVVQLTICLRHTHCLSHLVPSSAGLHPQRSCCLCWRGCRHRASRRRRRWPQHGRSCCSCQQAARV